VKAHGPEEENNTGLKEKASDISPDNDPVKAGVILKCCAEMEQLTKNFNVINRLRRYFSKLTENTHFSLST
jgi:hypothetical protein